MSESQQGENRSNSARRFTRSSQVSSSSATHISLTSPRQPPTQVEAPTKRLRSEVWLHMRKVLVGVDEYAICGICNARLSARSRNGTRHLKDHVHRCLEKRRERGEDAENDNHVFDKDKSRKYRASMIILHEYPLSFVEHVGFRKYSLRLQPKFKVVSRNTIKRDIFSIYEHEKCNTLSLLENVGSRVAITTDMWTAKPTKRGFMAVTAHFIDRDWILQSRILNFIYVPSPHNHEVLSNVLLSSLKEWGLERNLSSITVDNASANDAMIESVLEKLPYSSFLLEGDCLHMRCCAHILNLVVQEGMKVIEDSIKRIRESCLYWTSSQGRKENFEDMRSELDVPCTKSLILDVKTRWNSTYFMLDTALVYKEVFTHLRQRGERSYTCLPSEDDWHLARELVGKLKFFNTVTELFSGTKYITTNSYFPKVCEIKETLTLWLESPIEVIRTMTFKMLEKYDKYWNECHQIMCIACVLDPRYKIKLVKFYFKKLYGSDADYRIKKVEDTCYDLLHEYQSRLVGSRGNDVGSSRSHSTRVEEGENDPLANFDLFVEAESSASGAMDRSELDMYLRESLCQRTPDFDVLGWWRQNQGRFPILQQMARDILPIPVSTVASESSFSKSGQLIAPHRSRLHPTTLEALMCAQSWMWSEIRESTSIECPPFPPRLCDIEEDVEAAILSL